MDNKGDELLGTSSVYGENLNYVNAAVKDKLALHVDIVAEDDNDNDSDVKMKRRMNVRLLVKAMKDRLEEEGVTTRTLRDVFDACRGAFDERENLIDYN